MDWLAELLSAEMGMLILGVAGIIMAAKVIAKRVRSRRMRVLKRFAWKVEYLIPLVLGVCGSFLPGLFSDDKLGIKILKGLIAGTGTHWSGSLFQRLFKEEQPKDEDGDGKPD